MTEDFEKEIKHLSIEKTLEPDYFTSEFYQTIE